IAIETSGLADPAPILFTLGTDPMLDQRLRLSRVVTLVDAVEGAGTLDRFAEAARQAAVADALVISKTDLAPLRPDLAERLDALNPGPERVPAAAAADPAAVLFAPQSPSPARSGASTARAHQNSASVMRQGERVAEAQPRTGEGVRNLTVARPLTPTLSPDGG